MNVLDSEWLLRMLKKAGGNPRHRLLAVFDILGDWLDAPHMIKQFDDAVPDCNLPQALIEYLTVQARAAGAQQPELLAHQLCFMVRNMLQEALSAPASHVSRHAYLAAQALIRAQIQKEHFVGKRPAYAVAASTCLCAVLGGLLMMNSGGPASAHPTAASSTPNQPRQVSALVMASPRQTAAMFASLEQMRNGTCQYPEALMLPESQKSIYIDSVVGGQVPTMMRDQQVFDELLKKVRCNYTPMLMANSMG